MFSIVVYKNAERMIAMLKIRNEEDAIMWIFIAILSVVGTSAIVGHNILDILYSIAMFCSFIWFLILKYKD